jgi:hypothetical protein
MVTVWLARVTKLITVARRLHHKRWQQNHGWKSLSHTAQHELIEFTSKLYLHL